MIFILRITYLLATFLLLIGCQRLGLSDKISLENDAILIDIQEEITFLSDETKTMLEEAGKIKTFLAQPDMDPEIERSMEKELLEAGNWQKKIFELIAIRKIKQNKRIKLLNTRNSDQVDYSGVITQEEFDYFTNKKIKPMKKPWENRYRTAVDLNP